MVYESELTMLDPEAVAELCESQFTSDTCTIEIHPPPQPSVYEILPTPPPQPAARDQPNTFVSSPVVYTPTQVVSEDLIRTCVTPRKVKCVQETLKKSSQRHICALKLLPYFFASEELTNGNTDGSHSKECLDSTKLNSLKGKQNHSI